MAFEPFDILRASVFRLPKRNAVSFFEFVAFVHVTNLATFHSCQAHILGNFRDVRPRHPTRPIDRIQPGTTKSSLL